METTLAPAPNPPLQLRSEPTYEGWKRDRHALEDLGQDLRSEPTYEGWKPDM